MKLISPPLRLSLSKPRDGFFNGLLAQKLDRLLSMGADLGIGVIEQDAQIIAQKEQQIVQATEAMKSAADKMEIERQSLALDAQARELELQKRVVAAEAKAIEARLKMQEEKIPVQNTEDVEELQRQVTELAHALEMVHIAHEKSVEKTSGMKPVGMRKSGVVTAPSGLKYKIESIESPIMRNEGTA